MSIVTLALPDEIDAALSAAMEAEGVRSKEDFLLQVVAERFAQSKLERILLQRLEGPFTPFEPDWKEKVRQRAGELNAQ